MAQERKNTIRVVENLTYACPSGCLLHVRSRQHSALHDPCEDHGERYALDHITTTTTEVEYV